MTLILVATAAAQNMWLKKPSEQWTPYEVSRLLYDSPWAQTSIEGARSYFEPGIPDYPPEATFMVQARLFSALPVRQALIRRMQINVPYAELNAAQRADFNAEVDSLLKCAYCTEYYIVMVRSSRDDRVSLATLGQPIMIDVVALLKRVPEAELVQHVSLLNDKGVRRNAARVSFTKRNEVIFLFRRLDERQQPLITVANKNFHLEFDEFLTNKVDPKLKGFTFDVKKISQGNEVMF